MKITVSQLRRIIREEVENLSRPGSFAYGESPDPQDVHDAFLKLRDPYGQYRVLETDIAKMLGVKPEQIDYTGTGLMVDDKGVVTEPIGDTPYRSSYTPSI